RRKLILAEEEALPVTTPAVRRAPPPPQKATAETASHPKRSKNLSKYSAQGGVPVAEDGGRSNFRKRSKSIINEWTPASNEAGVC
ncbi:MAG TPA: hypothetical protein PLM13_18130, partial [Anaerolineales bacterium]|nr:hypothetical protein [Anaerolineales bacterium]